MRSLAEAKIKKVVNAQKSKTVGPWKPELKHILAATKIKAKMGKLRPGRYFFKGIHLHISGAGGVLLECPYCSQLLQNAVDYEDHLEDSHR